MKKALILCLADPSGNPRPKRIISLCKEQGFENHVVGFQPRNTKISDHYYVLKQPSVKFWGKLQRKLFVLASILFPHPYSMRKLRDLRWGTERLASELKGNFFDIIFVEDIYLLPYAIENFPQENVIMDAREYYPLELDWDFIWRLREGRLRSWVCRKYFSKCAGVLTVGNSLARKYEQEFDVHPVIVRSVPDYHDVPVRECGNPIRIVYHGGASPDRGLENLISLFPLLNAGRFVLDFYLKGEDAYIDSLKKMAAPYPQIKFNEPVVFEDIIPMLNGYDIGLCYFEPRTFNLANCLPNKFFEYIQARLMVISGPTPDMKELIDTYQCGTYCQIFSVSKLADVLNSITNEDVMAAKAKSNIAAKELCFNFEKNMIIPFINSTV